MNAPTRQLAAVLAAVLISAVLLAGCGGGGSAGTVSATTYAKSLCTALTPFEKDIASRSSALNLDARGTAAEGKRALQGFLGAIASDTATAAAQLRSAGTPDISGGGTVARQFVRLFTHLETTLKAAAQQADSLPTTSPQAFRAAAVALGNSVKSSMSNLGSAEVKSAALESAAKHVKACQSLG